MDISINFGGFYNSHHEYIAEQAVAYEIGAVDPDTGEIDHDKLYEFNDWSTVFLDYAQQWLDMLNSELDTDFKFISLDSPREYNFRTDVIYARASTADCLKVFKAVKEVDIKSDVYRIIRDRTTSSDGYAAFYKYGDIFEKENLHFLIEFMLDALLDSFNESYPFIKEDFYCSQPLEIPDFEEAQR